MDSIGVKNTAHFILRINEGYNNGFNVGYSFTYGGGADETDIDSIGTCAFTDREEEQVCKIEIIGDLNPEGNETIEITLLDELDYDLTEDEPITSLITITNDDL